MKLDRATAIRQLLFSRGQLSIAEIAEAVGASEPTVRRDLSVLESDGAIVRSHGGARIAEGSVGEIEFESREQINLEAKRAIGKAAYGLLRPNAAVFLDSGTTVLQLARLIRLRPKPLRIFTNCLPVAHMLLPVPELSVTLLGGTMRVQNASMVGPLAEATLSTLWFDQLFLGVGAVAPDAAIYSADEQEARINALMLDRTDTPVILADAAKFGEWLTYRVTPVTPNMRIVTDTGLAADWQSRLRDIGAEVDMADMP